MKATSEHRVRAVLLLGFNLLATVLMINLNKYIFARVNFGFPAALSNGAYLEKRKSINSALRRVVAGVAGYQTMRRHSRPAEEAVLATC